MIDAMLTAALLAAVLSGTTSSAARMVTSAEVEINGNGFITRYSGPGGDITIPERIAGKAVLGIADGKSKWGGVFADKGISGVRLPDTLTHIGDFAFFGNALRSLDVPRTVNTIGWSSFYFNGMRRVGFERGGTLHEIRGYAFAGNDLSQVDLPEGLKTIGKNAFLTNALASISVPTSVTAIEGGAFNNNRIAVMNGRPSNGLIYARRADGEEDHTTIVSYGGTSDIVDFIPATVSVIADCAFRGNGLTHVLIPEGITDIGDSAFSGNSLTHIAIPGSVSVVRWHAFSLNDLKTLVISDGVRQIEAWAFAFNKLTRVDIPSSVFDIGREAFYSNDTLAGITLPSSSRAGHAFLEWEDSRGGKHKAGDVVTDFARGYVANFASSAE
jgi:hypothetical protein